MEVIFLKDVKGSGFLGDIKDVSDGFARNFLIPHKLAAQPTELLRKKLELERKQRTNKTAHSQQDEQILVDKLQNLTINFSEKANEAGTLFSGITTQKIADQIHEKIGMSVQPSLIELAKPLKHAGVHQVDMRINKQKLVLTITINQ